MISMGKERLFYLDFIRAIAVMMIVLTHYNANFIGYNGSAQLSKIVLTEFPFGVYLGDLGVGLFMLISGSALWYVYGEKKINYFSFYKKRLISILPMFYIAYAAAFLVNFWINKGFFTNGISLKYFISTIFGFDTLMNSVGVPSFALVGEWFIGMIIIIYFLFPLLKGIVSRSDMMSILLSVLILIIFCLDIFNNNKIWHFLQLTIGFVPIFVIGMLLQKHIDIFTKKIMFFLSIIILVLNTYFKQNVLPEKFQMIYASLAFFVIAVSMSSVFNKNYIIRNIAVIISKYSYPIFLTHHFITNKMVNHFNIQSINIGESYILFLTILPVIFLCSWLLLKFNKKTTLILNSSKM